MISLVKNCVLSIPLLTGCGSAIVDGDAGRVALAAMTELETLDLYSNCIRDLTPLEGLTHLQAIDLRDNFYDCSTVATSLATIRGNGATIMDDCS